MATQTPGGKKNHNIWRLHNSDVSNSERCMVAKKTTAMQGYFLVFFCCHSQRQLPNTTISPLEENTDNVLLLIDIHNLRKDLGHEAFSQPSQ